MSSSFPGGVGIFAEKRDNAETLGFGIKSCVHGQSQWVRCLQLLLEARTGALVLAMVDRLPDLLLGSSGKAKQASPSSGELNVFGECPPTTTSWEGGV